MRAAIDLTIKSRRGSERAAALLLMAPTALRVEVATPFGLPALVATAGPDDITIFNVLERRAQTTRPSPAAVEHWLGVALPPVTLIRLLVGNMPAAVRSPRGDRRERAEPASHLDRRRGPAPGVGDGRGTARAPPPRGGRRRRRSPRRPSSSGAGPAASPRSGWRRLTGAPSSPSGISRPSISRVHPTRSVSALPPDIPVQRLD